jgi:ABC-2 type transport system permease protein
MSKFWRIAWQEYSRHVFRRRFLLALLSVPIMIAFMAVLIIVIIWSSTSPLPVGYVDQSGVLVNAIPQPSSKFPERSVRMQAFPDEASAHTALDAGKIQSYYVIPKNYMQTGKIEQYYNKEPKGMASQQFTEFMITNLLVNVPPQIADRIQAGTTIVVVSADKTRQASQDQIINIVLPFIAGILFIVAMSTSSGYLLQAVVEEKENRTMEIMVTSVSPNQLMSGKTIADMAVGLTQLFVWAVFIFVILIIGKSYVSFLSGFTFPVKTVAILTAVMVPAFIMVSGLMAAVGATVTEGSEGQQIMGLFTIPIWLPYILIGVFIQNPNSPLAVAMTLFPLTAPMTIAIRMGFTTIPAWQYITSLVLLLISAVGAVWLAGRAFRLGMLRYGQRVHWKEIFSQQRA